ncbi:MAG: hypothetical protein ACFFG0_44855 [Candidatus Thorarchaeota archaeon]
MNRRFKKYKKYLFDESDKEPIESRLFSMQKDSDIYFISSAESQMDYKDIIPIIIEQVDTKKTSTIIHAGWSLTFNPNESRELVLQYISENIKDINVENYIAEICNKTYTNSKYCIVKNQHKKIIQKICLCQQIQTSKEGDKAKDFVFNLSKSKSLKIFFDNEYPCILLICGENNLFNKENRGRNGIYVKSGSLSDKFLLNLQNIQEKQWVIFNPSHYPYDKDNMTKNVMKFHRSAIKDERIAGIITGNNFNIEYNHHQINRPLKWKSEKPIEMEKILHDDKNCIYISKCQI